MRRRLNVTVCDAPGCDAVQITRRGVLKEGWFSGQVTAGRQKVDWAACRSDHIVGAVTTALQRQDEEDQASQM